MIRLERFGRENYADLISWVDSAESLMQFGGPLFTYPLTVEQLDASLSDKDRHAFNALSNENHLSLGHGEIYLQEEMVKTGRILIGRKEMRGRGPGRQIVTLLLNYAFSHFERETAELNVFDWNIQAIRCYERVGFTINPEKKLYRKINDQIWVAINMRIDKFRYEKRKTARESF